MQQLYGSGKSVAFSQNLLMIAASTMPLLVPSIRLDGGIGGGGGGGGGGIRLGVADPGLAPPRIGRPAGAVKVSVTLPRASVGTKGDHAGQACVCLLTFCPP